MFNDLTKNIYAALNSVSYAVTSGNERENGYPKNR